MTCHTLFCYLIGLLYLIALLGGVNADDSLKGIVKVKTRKLSSTTNLPYDFYFLKFCSPKVRRNDVENLSEALFGDRIQNSIFNFKFMRDVRCQRILTTDFDIHNEATDQDSNRIVCPSSYSADDINDFIKKITDDYEVQLLADNLPVASRQSHKECGNMPGSSLISSKSVYFRPSGFPLGCMTKDNRYYLNNHWSFTIKYHRDIQKGAIYIVGADVVPSSIDYSKVSFSCNPNEELPESLPLRHRLELHPDTPLNSIPWSYSLKWEESSIKWASRWDAYANVAESDNAAIHWFTIINAVVIVFLLTAMVALIMLRAVSRDIKRYDENEEDESGWKLLHGDVFRPPAASALLSILYGNGMQLLAMTLVTMTFALLGMNHPENRGYLATVMLILFAFMGIIGGHQALRFYKMLNGTSWKLVTVMTALLFPSITLILYILGNSFLKILASSSSAVPFLTLVKIFLVWCGVSVPLVFIGGYFGYTQEKIKQPTEVNSIPRYIPDQPWYFSGLIVFLGAGILPFGAGVMEIYFIMTSIWLHKFYYVFGFLFIAFLIVLLTCAEITIVITYFQLCNENYKWWWRSFLMGGSCAFYMMLYSVFYFLTRIQTRTILLALVYFEYMSIISWFLFLITGSCGLLGSTWFVRQIYSQIKVS